MAIDRSVITIPPLMSVNATDKVTVPQQVTFNNGVFILNSSLGKTLSKSLYKVWSKENKVYLFERETTSIEKVIDSLASQITRTFKIGGSDSDFAFVNADGTQIAEKQVDRLFLTSVFNQYNNTPDNVNKTLSNYQPYTNTLVSSNFNNYLNKTFNAYSLKPDIVTSYIQFAKPTQELASLVNMNLFLRLKSLFSSKEINKDYYNYFTYLLAHWSLFGVDEVSFSSFQEKIRSDTLKQKLKAPLLEQDLVLKTSVSIEESKQYLYNSSNVKIFDNVTLYDTSEFNPTTTLIITDLSGYSIIDEDNYSQFYNKVFVFVDVDADTSSVIETIEFYNVGDTLKAAINYKKGMYYSSLGGSPLVLSEWSRDRETRISNSRKKYKLLVYNKSEYLGFPVQIDKSILELTLNSTFRTNTQGDFYVVEIVQ